MFASLDVLCTNSNHSLFIDKKTLIDVLERRQVTFANQDLVAPPPARHRRYQSELLDNHIGVDTPRPSSAPSSSDTDTQQSSSNSRPTLHNRGTSYGSRRNLLQRSPASLRRSNRSSTGDWVGGAENGSDNPAATYQRDNRPRLASLPTVNYPTRSSRHHRGKSGNVVYVRSDSSGSQASSLISGLTTPGERARYVALQMKMAAGSNNTEDTIGVNANLPDLMNAIEAQRESDELSNGNQHKSVASSSRDSSRAANSKSGSTSSPYRYRPFSGISSSPFSHGGRKTSNGVEQLFQVAERVQELCQIEEENEASDDDDNDAVKLSNSIVLEEENANFLSQIAASHPAVPNMYAEDNVDDGAVDTEATVDEQTPILSKRLSHISEIASRRRPPASLFDSITKPNPDSRFYKVRQWLNGFRNRFKMLMLAFNFPFVTERMWGFIQNELTMFIVPALAVSYFFFYQMNNPTLFKTEASISWWILFCLRHYCTLLLACISPYIFVDVLALQSMMSIQMIGPLATLYTINGKGWPFVLTAWGLINFLLIQENSDSAHHFFSHWLYYTDVELFSAENPSGNGKCIL